MKACYPGEVRVSEIYTCLLGSGSFVTAVQKPGISHASDEGRLSAVDCCQEAETCTHLKGGSCPPLSPYFPPKGGCKPRLEVHAMKPLHVSTWATEHNLKFMVWAGTEKHVQGSESSLWTPQAVTSDRSHVVTETVKVPSPLEQFQICVLMCAPNQQITSDSPLPPSSAL